MTKKRISIAASFALCCVLLLGGACLAARGTADGLFALTADAAEIVHSGNCGANGDNVTWTLDSDGVLTISGTGEMEDYCGIMDDGIDYYMPSWYSFRASVKSVVIENGVTGIGDFAFEDCDKATTATIPDSVTRIGSCAFYYCRGLTDVTIPDSVTNIGDSAFSYCSGLPSVTIPGSVTSIGKDTFSGCSGLTDVTIQDSVTSIGESVFSGCSGLTSVTIPDSVTSIGESAFHRCSGLTSVTIPDGVTSIGRSAFSGCAGLEVIRVSENNAVFYSKNNCVIQKDNKTLVFGCKTSVIPADGSVTSIGNYAFYACRELTSVTIPDSVTSIGFSAFEQCSGLTSVTIPGSVTRIGAWAFELCSGLTSVTIEDGVACIDGAAFYCCRGLATVTIPDSVTSIAGNAFYGTAWYNAQPDGLVYAGKFVLGYKGEMPANTSIVIVDGTKGICDGVFYRCSNLTSVTIPDSVTSIGDSAFYYCDHLTAVYISDLAAWCDISFSNSLANPLSYAHHLYVGGAELTELVIPDGVTGIGMYAFSGCSGLTSVTIPDGVTSIGNSAFEDCSGLTTMTIPDGVTSIGNSAFEDCNGLTSVTIPDSVTSIGYEAFSGCSGLTSVTIPDSVTSIGNYAFYGCNSLTAVHINDLAAWCGISFGDSFASPFSSAFHLFVDGAELTELVIPNGITNIGHNIFSGCSGLTSVTIPDSVTSIGGFAFSGCSGLTSVTIPDSVTSIGNSVFSGCESLSEVYYTGTEAQWNAIAIGVNNSVLLNADRYYRPTVPQSVSAQATGEKEITVSWASVRGATQYNVYRYNGTAYKYVGTTFATAAKPTEYADGGLTVGTDYYYKVVAVYKGGGLTLQSGKSAFAHTVALGTPAAPTNVTARPTGEKELTISWNAVKGATQYNVYRYRGSDKQYHYLGTTFATAADPTRYIDSGLSVGTAYYYKVVAVCKGSGLTFVGEMSSSVNAKVLGTPAVPTNVTVKPTAEKELTVSWSAVKGATQYNVYRYNGTAYKYIGTTLSTAAKPTQYVDTGLTVGTDYYYKVVAVVKGSGLTFVSEKSAFAHTVALGKTNPPANVTVKPTAEKELTVTWSAVKGATQYNVYRYNGTSYQYIGTTLSTAAKPTQYVDTGLTVGTDYYYKVVAVVKGSGFTYVSGKSAFAHTVALGTPAVPANVTARPTGAKELTISWNAVRGATQYNVYRYRGSDKAYHYIGTTFATAADPTQYADTGLTAGTSYYYKVVAVCKGSGLTFVSGKSAFACAAATAG